MLLELHRFLKFNPIARCLDWTALDPTVKYRYLRLGPQNHFIIQTPCTSIWHAYVVLMAVNNQAACILLPLILRHVAGGTQDQLTMRTHKMWTLPVGIHEAQSESQASGPSIRLSSSCNLELLHANASRTLTSRKRPTSHGGSHMVVPKGTWHDVHKGRKRSSAADPVYVPGLNAEPPSSLTGSMHKLRELPETGFTKHSPSHRQTDLSSSRSASCNLELLHARANRTPTSGRGLRSKLRE